MCGIAGIYNRGSGEPVAAGQVAAMLAAVRHRGPEAAGIYLDGPVGLGHDRLSIIDLSGGLQPIGNEDGTVWISCNGEVFNYVELRAELLARGHRFRTGSDCEVIVHLYEDFGPDCLQYLIGQFAFALWDSKRQRLMLVRDRLGIRPLYYAEAGGGVIFASEIKALFATGRIAPQIDLRALDQVFTYWAALPGRSAFSGVNELPPAHRLVVEPGSLRLERYWSVDYSAGRVAAVRGESYYADALLDLLIDATRLRLRADVPVGAYLSGGLDSSTIASIVRRYTGNALKTFSIAFRDAQFDERAHQQRMADYLGTEHVSIECTDEDIAAIFPDVVYHLETPTLRTAPAPMFMLSDLVRRHGLKVVLTGEGADEFLGGYDIFKEARVRRFWAARPASKLRPLLLRRLYDDIAALSKTSDAYLSAFFKQGLDETGDPCYSHLVRWRSTARLKRLFGAETRAELAAYSSRSELELALEGLAPDWAPLDQAQFVESRTFMSQYLLSSQGDRVAMAHAVEGRFPFLDHRVVEFAATIPAHLRLKGLTEKHILRRAVGDLLPAAVLARTKRPYRAPIKNAFLGANPPEYVRELLSERALRDGGIFDPAGVTMLVNKCRAAATVGEADSMALVGVLSTQLLHHLFVAGARQQPAPDFAAVVVENPALRERSSAVA